MFIKISSSVVAKRLLSVKVEEILDGMDKATQQIYIQRGVQYTSLLLRTFQISNQSVERNKA